MSAVKAPTPAQEAVPQPTIPEGMLAHHSDPSLHGSREVEDVVRYLAANSHGIDPALKGEERKIAKVSQYLGFLADPSYVNDGTLTGDAASRERQVEAHIIQSEKFKPSFLDVHIQAAFNQGRGRVDTVPEGQQAMFKEVVREDQRGSLGIWYEYLTANEAGYPTWFRKYAADGVVKLGVYDKEKGTFTKRSPSTTLIFPDLNAEALAYTYEKVKGQLEAKQAGDMKAVKETNFGKLYAEALGEVGHTSDELKKITEGQWVKFDQSDKMEDAEALANSLRGYGTGWCTAGRSTAHEQLKNGDFYIYFTPNAEGEYKVPRVAVRMAKQVEFEGDPQGYDAVNEVRGIGPGQEIELPLRDVVEEAVKTLPEGEIYIAKEQDMTGLTALYDKVERSNNVTLTDDEIILLYELDHPIQGFGYPGVDPRPAELKKMRGGQDAEAIKRLIPEVIRRQSRSAFEAYRQVAERLGKGSLHLPYLSRRAFERRFNAIDRKWRQNGLYDFVVDQFVNHGVRYKLTATPQLEMGSDQLVAFIKDYPSPVGSYVDPETYRDLPRKVIKNPGVKRVDFGLMPDAMEPRLEGKNVYEARSELTRLQQSYPERSYRVPTVADAMTYWTALRTKGEMPNTDFEWGKKTKIVHFTPEYTNSGFVPVTSIGYRNQPALERQRVTFATGTGGEKAEYRLLIG